MLFKYLLMASAGSAGQAGYIIPNSAYSDGSTGYLSRTPSVSTNNKKFSFSCWVKLTNFSVRSTLLFSQDTGVNYTALFFKSSADSQAFTLEFRNVEGTANVITSPVFRDPSGWYHILLTVDTDNATAADRVKIYVNGVECAYQVTNYPAQFATTYWNNTYSNRIWNYAGTINGQYLGQIANIAGQVLTPVDFGKFDVTGNWIPIDITGLTFGTNGFLLTFENGTDLGEDTSGNGNDFTVNGTIVQTTDTPTDDAANDVGNYNTLNPLDISQTFGTLSNGGLTYTTGSANNEGGRGSILITGGKFRFRMTMVTTDSGTPWGGIVKSSHQSWRSDGSIFYATADAWIITCDTGSIHLRNNGSNVWNGSSVSNGDTVDFIFDADNGRIYVAHNGVMQNSGNPDAGTGYVASGVSGGPFLVCYGTYNTGKITFDFGQNGYTPPANCTTFKPLCTANLPAPASAASVTPIVGTFTGFTANAASYPYVNLGYKPDTAGASTINGNNITWGTHAIPTANGFKIITSSSSYNNNGVSNSFSISVERPFGGQGVNQAKAA